APDPPHDWKPPQARSTVLATHTVSLRRSPPEAAHPALLSRPPGCAILVLHHRRRFSHANSCPAPRIRRQSAQQVQQAFPVAHAAFIASPHTSLILCTDTGLRSKP
ncbi:hypothetical protein B0H19DRAFT_1371017, partial [Mycena capillaripes]